jgi:hypothetical protein
MVLGLSLTSFVVEQTHPAWDRAKPIAKRQQQRRPDRGDKGGPLVQSIGLLALFCLCMLCTFVYVPFGVVHLCAFVYVCTFAYPCSCVCMCVFVCVCVCVCVLFVGSYVVWVHLGPLFS